MSNDRDEAAKREAAVYLHLAERFGWTPSEIEKIPPHVRTAMADDLAADKQPAEALPADEPLAEWERELLERSGAAATASASMGMNFGEALDQLKQGARVYRSGWNGKGMWLALSPGFSLGPGRVFSIAIREAVERTGQDGVFRPYLMMRTVDGEFVPWVASQTDLLADDWLVRIERPSPEANRWLNDARIEGPADDDGTTTSGGMTVTLHLDGRAIYDAIRPHVQNARQIERMRQGNPLGLA